LAWVNFRPRFFYFFLPCSWIDRHKLPHSACWLRWGLVNFLPRLGLNFDLPDLHVTGIIDVSHGTCPGHSQLLSRYHAAGCLHSESLVVILSSLDPWTLQFQQGYSLV
jgi:hypothetical protein